MAEMESIEADDRFPSGKWVGFFTDKRISGRHEMELLLTFRSGSVTGTGRDRVAPFAVEGSYRTDDGSCGFRKIYTIQHVVLYAGFNDFHFYRVAVRRAHLVAGFGKIRWLSAPELMTAPPPAGLAEDEDGIISHMNEDHADAVQLYAGKLLGLPGNDWRMTGIDAEGIDLRQGGWVARLAFDAPLSAANEARKVLVALVAKARSA